jgi:hypothetical protein
MEGKILGAPKLDSPVIRISRPGVTLRNATIDLPPGCYLEVTAAGMTVLRGVKLNGASEPGMRGLLCIVGESCMLTPCAMISIWTCWQPQCPALTAGSAVTANITLCKVTCSVPTSTSIGLPPNNSACAGIRVDDGATAVLHKCALLSQVAAAACAEHVPCLCCCRCVVQGAAGAGIMAYRSERADEEEIPPSTITVRL